MAKKMSHFDILIFSDYTELWDKYDEMRKKYHITGWKITRNKTGYELWVEHD